MSGLECRMSGFGIEGLGCLVIEFEGMRLDACGLRSFHSLGSRANALNL